MNKHIVKASLGMGIDLVKKLDKSIWFILNDRKMITEWRIYSEDNPDENVLNWANRIFLNIFGYCD